MSEGDKDWEEKVIRWTWRKRRERGEKGKNGEEAKKEGYREERIKESMSDETKGRGKNEKEEENRLREGRKEQGKGQDRQRGRGDGKGDGKRGRTREEVVQCNNAIEAGVAGDAVPEAAVDEGVRTVVPGPDRGRKIDADRLEDRGVAAIDRCGHGEEHER